MAIPAIHVIIAVSINPLSRQVNSQAPYRPFLQRQIQALRRRCLPRIIGRACIFQHNRQFGMYILLGLIVDALLHVIPFTADLITRYWPQM